MEKEFELNDFKRIFFWEYIHRMSGRGIAVLFVLPALYFLRKGWITKSMKPRLVIYGGLLAFQVMVIWLCRLNVCCFLQGVPKNDPTFFCQNFIKSPNLIIFGTQIVTLLGDYQYQIAHFCIINSTKDIMGFNNFVVLNILH